MNEAMICLAVALFFESRDQGYEGKLAVAQTIMKRVETKHRGFDTICGVVKDKHQFSFYTAGLQDDHTVLNRWDMKAWERSYFLASAMLAEGGDGSHFVDITGGATHYHASYVAPNWSCPEKALVIGDHLFFNNIKDCKKEAHN